jgi:DNA-directed RNA polymerase delta subunit
VLKQIDKNEQREIAFIEITKALAEADKKGIGFDVFF